MMRSTPMLTVVAISALLAVAACNSGLIAIDDLAVGDCFDDPDGEDEIAFIQTVPCEEPHQNEVYANVTLTQFESFPGQVAMDDAALLECFDQFEGFVGTTYEVSSLDIAFLTPTEESWDDGDRGVTCAVYSLEGQPLVGSVRGSGR